LYERDRAYGLLESGIEIGVAGDACLHSAAGACEAHTDDFTEAAALQGEDLEKHFHVGGVKMEASGATGLNKHQGGSVERVGSVRRNGE
jgi:hypothetical protein